MPDTLPNIKIPAGTWVDLYAATSIVVGTRIVAENLSGDPVKLYSGATVPVDAEKLDGSFNRVMGYRSKVNDDGDLGAWAYSDAADGLISVKVFM